MARCLSEMDNVILSNFVSSGNFSPDFPTLLSCVFEGQCLLWFFPGALMGPDVSLCELLWVAAEEGFTAETSSAIWLRSRSLLSCIYGYRKGLWRFPGGFLCRQLKCTFIGRMYSWTDLEEFWHFNVSVKKDFSFWWRQLLLTPLC